MNIVASQFLLPSKSPFLYFQSLEKRIRFALGIDVYVLFLALLFMIVDGSDLEKLSSSYRWIFVCSLLVVGVVTVAGVKRIEWSQELHIWVDHKLFGFVSRSNDYIAQAMIQALGHSEREMFRAMEKNRLRKTIQSVFSALSGDAQFVQRMMQGGMFSMWTWYWIALYGTITWTVGASLLFIKYFLFHDDFIQVLFYVSAGWALLYLVVSLYLGRQLVRVSKATGDSIVAQHKEEIVEKLRVHLKTESRVSAEQRS